MDIFGGAVVSSFAVYIVYHVKSVNYIQARSLLIGNCRISTVDQVV